MRPDHPHRSRVFYAMWIIIVIGAGLASRSSSLALPPFAAKYSGDALWALMIFFGLGLLMPAGRTRTVSGIAIFICVAVECSQLYHAPTIDAVRRTWFGRLTLGDVFGWGDILAYLVGIAAGGLTEVAVSRGRKRYIRAE